MPTFRTFLLWLGLAIAVGVPVAVATTSPYLAWRDPVYIGAGFAGIVALALMLFQPLLAAGLLPGLPPRPGRQVHRWIGGALVVLVLLHVGGLWITSPPDALDALLFNSPTPFSIWGVVAMWAVFATVLLAAFRHQARISPRLWRIGHTMLVVVIVVGSIVHALLVDGAMGLVSKAMLCLLVAVATLCGIVRLKVWILLRSPQSSGHRP